MFANADLSHFLTVTEELWAVVAVDGAIVEHNPAWQRLLGHDDAALRARPLPDLVATDDRDRLLAALAAATTTPQGPVLLALRGADDRRHLRHVWLSSAGGDRLRLHARAPAPTAEATMLAAAINTVPIILWQIDRDGRFVMSEGGYLANIGLQPGQVVGLSAFDVYKDFPTILDLLRCSLAGEASRAVTQLGDHHFGNLAYPLRDAAGRVIGALGLSIDITAQVQAEQAVRAQNERLEQQQRLLLAMSLPILQVWDGVLCVPLIGHVDAARVTAIIDTVLRAVSQRRARTVILDVTGLEEIDTQTASQLVHVLRGALLLGARGMVVGIRPQIAQTLVTLGVALDFETLGTLQDALRRVLADSPA